jgi:diketogulonate reductase-like aldo/keto reductase
LNEKGVGYGIIRSKVDRKNIWITSKLDPNEYADASNAIDGILQRLQTDYVDLLYLHHPAGELSTIVSAYKAMEKAYKEGKVRALGISNFDNRMETYNAIMQEEIKPQIMQIECHPYAQRKETRELVKTYDIQVECWYPLNHGFKEIFTDTTLSSIAKAHNKNVPQVILRWHIQEGLCPVPGSTNASHIAENINIFDFELSEEEMKLIRGLDKGEEGRSYNIQYTFPWPTVLSNYDYDPEFLSDDKSDIEIKDEPEKEPNSSDYIISIIWEKYFIVILLYFFA